MAKRNRTAVAILGFLSRRPMSGYDIRRMVDKSIGYFWSESFGQIYPVLRKLAEAGLVRRVDAESGGGRAQNKYALTPQGRKALKQWLRQPPVPAPGRHELLLQLFFGRHAGVAACIRKIEEYRARQAALLEAYDAIAVRLERDMPANPDLPYWMMTVTFGQRSRGAAIDWCDQTLAQLRTMAAPTQANAGTRSRQGEPK